MTPPERFDVVILGSGAAGLSTALRLPSTLSVAVLAKSSLHEGSTWYAQGGVSAVLDSRDSIASHCADTLNAGAGLCDPQTVRYVVERGPQAIRWLMELGVDFTREPGSANGLHLTREGGHSHRRVVHAADATGRAIETVLLERTRQAPHLHVFEHHIAVDIIHSARLGLHPPRCLGVYVLDLVNRRVRTLAARAVVLATGGASKVYLYTSNPDGSTGDGIAMAWRAGCRVANLEFIQFHPTCLYHPQAKSFLISEAVRGEGGLLILGDGERFMPRFDPRAELAPRDIVARAIDHEMKRTGADCVWLDIRHKGEAFIREHFPNIYARCLQLGIDMSRQPLPVVPAAHYTCGGVLTNLDGRTDLPGLYAVGECAYTGLHGANRMASNSLLECLVFADSVARDIARRWAHWPEPPELPPWDESRVTDSSEDVVVAHDWDELRRLMWDYVGIVRTSQRLQRAQRRVHLLLAEIADYYSHFRISRDLIELRNLAQCASLIIDSALQRRDSRGLHYTLDYPAPDPALEGIPTVLVPPNFAGRLQPPA